MIFGVGIDVLIVERMHKVLQKSTIMHDFFHPAEIVFSATVSDKVSYFASCFTAKEAFLKALGVGIAGFHLSDMCLSYKKVLGQTMLYYGSVLQFVKQNVGNCLVSVSTTVDKTYAIAVVVIEIV